jgi:hypothetical protein
VPGGGAPPTRSPRGSGRSSVSTRTIPDEELEIEPIVPAAAQPGAPATRSPRSSGRSSAASTRSIVDLGPFWDSMSFTVPSSDRSVGFGSPLSFSLPPSLFLSQPAAAAPPPPPPPPPRKAPPPLPPTPKRAASLRRVAPAPPPRAAESSSKRMRRSLDVVTTPVASVKPHPSPPGSRKRSRGAVPDEELEIEPIVPGGGAPPTRSPRGSGRSSVSTRTIPDEELEIEPIVPAAAQPGAPATRSPRSSTSSSRSAKPKPPAAAVGVPKAPPPPPKGWKKKAAPIRITLDLPADDNPSPGPRGTPEHRISPYQGDINNAMKRRRPAIQDSDED